MGPRYKVHDNLCDNKSEFQVMSFSEGPFAGVPFRLNELNVTEDGRLEYSYDLYNGNDTKFDSDGFDEAVGEFLIQSLNEMVQVESALIDQETQRLLDEAWPDDGVNIIEEDE